MNDYLKYIGDQDQLISYKEGYLSNGADQGVRFMHVQNGSGLSATILPGRCMDIYHVRYTGRNIIGIEAAA